MRPEHWFISISLLLLIACDNDQPAIDPVPIKVQTADTTANKGYQANGLNEVHDKNGLLVMRGERVNGLREGEWESFFPDGTLRSKGTFVNDIRQGPTTVYHENGAIFYSGWYDHGKPVKEWTFYDPDGSISKIVTYSDDGTLLEQKEP